MDNIILFIINIVQTCTINCIGTSWKDM